MRILEEQIFWDGNNENISISYGSLMSDVSGEFYFKGRPDPWHSPTISSTDGQWRKNYQEYDMFSIDIRLHKFDKPFPDNLGFSFYSWFYGTSNTINLEDYIDLETLSNGEWHTLYIPITDFTDNNERFIFNKTERMYFSKTPSGTYYEIDVDNVKAVKVFKEKLPDVNFSSDITTGIFPLEVHFTDESISYNTNIVSWLWDFGDSNTSIEKNPTHLYEEEGTYNVSLTVTTDESTEVPHLKFDFIDVTSNYIPDVNFTYDVSTGENPLSVTFENTTVVNNANVIDWYWDFGDNIGRDEMNPGVHTYEKPGTYTVALIAITDTSQQYAEIKNDIITVGDSGWRPPVEGPAYARVGLHFKKAEYYIMDDMSYMKIPIVVDNFGQYPIKSVSFTGEREGMSTVNNFPLAPGEREETYYIYIKNNLIEDIEFVESAHVIAYVNRVIRLAYEKFRTIISLETLISMIRSIWNSDSDNGGSGDSSSPPSI